MDRFAEVDELLATVAGQHRVPAVAAAVVVDGEVAHTAAQGFRDSAHRLPMTVDTPSRWYSISKPLTALALAQRIAEGKLRWDQPVSQFVSGLRFGDDVATERADVRDCLLHRTGLPSGDWTWWQGPTSPAALLERLPHFDCCRGFRNDHHYQNLHFTILGEVFKATGIDWHEAMQHLLSPLGITPLTRLEAFIHADRALGYGPNGLTDPVLVDDFDFEAVAPASAVCGSVTELARLARALVHDGRDLLPRALWAEVTQPRLALPAGPWPELRQPCVALAGRSVVYRGEWMLQWAGGFRGYVSHLLAVPQRRAAACALANRTSSEAAELLAFSLLDRAIGWEPLPWPQRFLERKRTLRCSGEKRLADRFARPSAPWPVTKVCGRFMHPGYGDLAVDEVDGRPHLRFRHVVLPLVPRPDGTISADGSSMDASEVCWDLQPVIEAGRITAWLFNPDNPATPCRFRRVE